MARRSRFSLAAVLFTLSRAAVSHAADIIEAPPITITAKPQPVEVFTAPQSVTVLEGRQLDRQRGQNLSQAIESAPGVSAVTTGVGVGKPVVRGLSAQRVLILSDGIRQEGHSWGDEHGPEIDTFNAEKIEVVRGPLSLLYGADALGGVVSVKSEDPPFDSDRPVFGGKLMSNAFSNNRSGGGALSLYGARGGVGFRAYGGGRSAGDTRTPAGHLRNSGAEEFNGGGSVGVKKDWGQVSLGYTRFDQRLEIAEDPAEAPDATPYQKITHDKVRLNGDFPFEWGRMEVNSGWQRNNRREFEAKDSPTEALNLVLRTHTWDVKAHHNPLGPVTGTLGFQGMLQKNETLAEEKLVPGYDLRDLGVFVYEELPVKQVTFSAGARFDNRRIGAKDEPVLGVASQRLTYDAVTGAAGAVWRIAEPWALALNVGTGWRAPSPFELFVNGEHEGTGRFLVGNAGFKTERSLNKEVSLRYRAARLSGELGVFHNRVDRFLFLAPTGADDVDSGLPIFQYRQADATLVGVELALKAQPVDWLVLDAGADYLRARNEQTKEPLPLIPANRMRLGAKLVRRSLGKLVDPYLGAKARLVARQNRVANFETKTAGYALFDFGVGADVPLLGNRVSVDLGLENAFDQPYRDHLSRYKAFALNPGRNATLKLSVPFGG